VDERLRKKVNGGGEQELGTEREVLKWGRMRRGAGKEQEGLVKNGK
jgi:hypothetical protein